MTSNTAELELALAQTRLRLHLRVLPMSLLVSAAMGVTVMALLWPVMPTDRALGWLAALGMVLALRLSLCWRAPPEAREASGAAGPSVAGQGVVAAAEAGTLRAVQRSTWPHRLGFAAHGIVWAVLLPLSGENVPHHGLDVLVFAMAALAGGALVTSAFDRKAAWLFAGPVLLALAGRLLLDAEHRSFDLAAVLALFVATMALGLHRVHGVWANGVAHALNMDARLLEVQQAQAALAERTQDLQRTLEATGEAIFSSSARHADEPLRFVNKRMREMWNLPPQGTLTPRQVMEAARPNWRDVAAEEARVQAIIAANAPNESTLELRDGRIILRRTIPASSPNGPVRVWSFRDITTEHRALQALRAAEEEQRLLLEAFPGYITGLDETLHYVFANRPAAALLGFEPQQLIGRQVKDVLGEAVVERTRLEMQRAWAGQPTLSEREYPATATREALTLEVAVVAGAPLQDGRRVCYAFGIDITARKRAEAALIVARDAADKANRAKSQFLAHMSHELRTPLNAILGYAQLLRTDPSLAPNELHQQQLHAIETGGGHLLALINELLDLGRVESGQLEALLVPVPLGPLLDEALALVRPLVDAQGLTVRPPTLSPDAAVMADPMRLKQVLLNLLGNAVKYNRYGGELAVELQAQEASAWPSAPRGSWRITVRDTGVGLSAEQRERLFTPFERLGAERGGVEGSGIGLALSRRLVELMGGRIGVESQPGVGSSFWVELPQALDDDALAVASQVESSGMAVAGGADSAFMTLSQPGVFDTAASPAAPPQRRVLYVEDNPVNAALMQAMLARLPEVALSIAEDPQEGLLMAASLRPHLIFLDIQLPGMDGFELFQRLRTQAQWRGAPVVAVSANGQDSDIAAARAAGFTDYLTKPLALEQLLATTKRLLRLS